MKKFEFEMTNMKKLKNNASALEHLYLVSPAQCKLIGDVSEALTTLSKEFERASKGKCIESDEKLQMMALEYYRACQKAEEVFGSALEILKLTDFKF